MLKHLRHKQVADFCKLEVSRFSNSKHQQDDFPAEISQ
ncbi:hypothetical protein JCM19240_5334 [Vibrio maritimus]|uniref:Uncharacterized protein n=1 Tax=Vibrio maritimus TaxID=990268 RepID=A0A090SYC0_9VIBR|nr:hypothetical protein JCM19240_5334 [Vibrio maritimus]